MNKPISIGLSEINAAAPQIAARLTGGEILALAGDLGSGKTTFTKALAKALGVKKTVTSPTFIIMNRYPIPHAAVKWLYHLDLYRTNSFAEVQALGLEEIWGQPDTVTVIEWADKIDKHLPKFAQFIHFSN